MDFLSLFLLYVACLLISIVMICVVTKNQRLKAAVLGGAQVALVPGYCQCLNTVLGASPKGSLDQVL